MYVHRCRKQTCGNWGEKAGGGLNWEIEIDIYTLLYIEQINNSTGNSIQYSVMTCMGIESKRKWIYVYV